MPNFELKDKSYATSLQTGDLFLVQTDPGGARTVKKFDWGRLSGVFNDQINATGSSLSDRIQSSGTALQNQITAISTGTFYLHSNSGNLWRLTVYEDSDHIGTLQIEPA